MELCHADERLQRLEADPGFDAGLAPDTVRLFRRRMLQIRAARDSADLAALKSLGFRRSHSVDARRYRVTLDTGVRLLMQLDDLPPPPKVTVLALENESAGDTH
jgi:plasmid maintenance system killer protein